MMLNHGLYWNHDLVLRTYRRLFFGSSYSASRSMIYMILAFAVLLMSWEAGAADMVIAGQTIPEQSIRLRILANSDSPADQLLKRRIRDVIVDQMREWVTEPLHIEQARAMIEANIPEIERLVGETIKAHGFDYDFKVELGQVEFPAKIYGNQVYPAGVYEALRISIGKAEGQNWWCVLFPPLCFVDMVSGREAVAYAGGKTEAITASASDAAQDEESSQAAAQPPGDQEKEVRFFLWDLLQELIRRIGSWFR